MTTLLGLVFAALGFTLSASAGMGGSLLLVPSFCLIYGTKEGVAIAALLLGANNVAKVIAYRKSVPWKKAALVALATAVGALVGARLLVMAPEELVQAGVITVVLLALLADWRRWNQRAGVSPTLLALAAGATSGFSGTSGPLKGVALRRLQLNRMQLVGAASVVSLIGDGMKVSVYAHGGVLPQAGWTLALWALPLMPICTLLGRHINQRIGERAYAGLFWTVMIGYSVRLLLA